MKMIRCPGCDSPLPDEAHYCTSCGESLTSPGHAAISGLTDEEHEETLQLEPLEEEATVPIEAGEAISYQGGALSASRRAEEVSAAAAEGTPRGGLGLVTAPLTLEQLAEQEEDEEAAHGTWHKDVTPTPNRARAVYPPRPAHSNPRMKTQETARLGPTLAIWTSLLVMIVLVLGGVFGVVVTQGRGVGIPNQKGLLTLQITPNNVAVGATMTLRGTNFSPHGRIGLTRDLAVPVVDTAGAVVVEADGQGGFTDTVVITGDWGAGIHTLNAEDALTHRVASFPVTVTGQNASMRPPHLRLNVTSLDLGSEDQLTSSAKTVSLVDMGGGQVAWQSSTNQSWLLVSPPKGTFSSGQSAQVTIGVDRQNLSPGSYDAQVTFTSNGGTVVLPVKMQVTPAQPHHGSAFAVSPSLLSFAGVDGGSSPGEQAITITNPGTQPLQWNASGDQDWLTFSQRNGTVAGSGSQTVKIGVNTSSMLPGSYNGTVTLATGGDGTQQGSTQTVSVNITISAGCVLQTSPGTLAFTGVSQRSGVLSQNIQVNTAQGCNSAVHWNASSNAGWLSIGTQSGSVPTTATVSVNTAGMAPGNYQSAITFTSQAGTLVLPVTFTVGQAAAPALATSPGSLGFSAASGQSSPAAQGITLTNSGGSTLNWTAAASTSVGGNWLGVSPAGGSLGPGQSTTVSVTSSLLNSLVPGSYNGAVTISGSDNTGHAAPGSPKTIPVSFTVNAPCSFSASSGGLSFGSAPNQGAPASQPITIAAGGNCQHALSWTASLATVPAGGSWLSVTPASGTATTANSGTANVSVAPAGLTPGTYRGTVTIVATDSATGAAVGSAQSLPVTLTVQQGCTLQAPSSTSLTFNANAGKNPAAQTFSVSAAGACSGGISLTPKVSLNSGSGWLSVSPASTTIASGTSATFTVQVSSAGLAAGSYTGAISLGATSGGNALAGSPATIAVALNVASLATPTPSPTPTQAPTPTATPVSSPTATATTAAASSLGVNPSSVTFNVTTGSASQPVSIINSGGGTLNWRASLAQSAPKFVSLSAAAGSQVAGGASATLDVNVNATGLPGGSSYTTSLLLSAVDGTTGNAVSGSPVSIPITINVATASMQLSASSLSFSAVSGHVAAAQSIIISNGGGDGLTWSVSKPTQAWLQVSPAQGSDASGASSTLTMTASATALPAGQYSAQVIITPSTGSPVTVNVTITVTAAASTPSPSPPPTPPPTTSPSSTATSHSSPTATSSPSLSPTAEPTSPPTSTPASSAAGSHSNTAPTSTPHSQPTRESTATPTQSVPPTATPTHTTNSGTGAPQSTPTATPTVTPVATPIVHRHKHKA